MKVPALADVVPEDRLKVAVVVGINEVDQVDDIERLFGLQVVGAKVDRSVVVMGRGLVVSPNGRDGRFGVVERSAERLDDGDDSDNAPVEGVEFPFKTGFEKYHDSIILSRGASARVWFSWSRSLPDNPAGIQSLFA